MTYDELPAMSPGRRFLRLVRQPDGAYREATDREIWLNYIRNEWAATAGAAVPPDVMARAAAAYDAGNPPLPARALDIAA